MGGIFHTTFLNAFSWIKFSGFVSLKFDHMVPISNKPILVQIMAWCRIGKEPLSELVMVYFTGTCMYHTASGWVNILRKCTMIILVRAWCMFNAKPLPEPALTYCQTNSQEQTLSSKLKTNAIVIYFFKKSAFENIAWKMFPILFGQQCIKQIPSWRISFSCCWWWCTVETMQH